jgi:hypothetical protein
MRNLFKLTWRDASNQRRQTWESPTTNCRRKKKKVCPYQLSLSSLDFRKKMYATPIFESTAANEKVSSSFSYRERGCWRKNKRDKEASAFE